MLIQIENFKGEVPQVHPRLLPEAYAQVALNTRLDNGTINPVRMPRPTATLPAPAESFVRFRNEWLGFAGKVDATPGPVAQDRLYYTGDGLPKMRVGATVYNLKLPPPATAPTATAIGGPGTDPESTLFAYTFVTAFGEESAPSPVSAPLLIAQTVSVTLSAFAAPTPGRNVTARRLYRSVTTTTGITDLFFVAEIPLATTNYTHDPATAPIQEPLPTTSFDVPDDDLAGLTSMPNGMMAAFVGQDLYFCEPYQPHAWPVKYALATDAPIVGLAAFGSTLAVLTTVSPYIVQGTHPDNMVMEKVDGVMPCLSARGIVDMGYAAYFPSTDGIAMVSQTGTQLVTMNVFTREQWRALGPETIIADQFSGRYVFTFIAGGNSVTYYGGDAETSAPPTVLIGGDATTDVNLPVVTLGNASSAYGVQQIGVLDTTGQQAFFMRSTVDAPSTMFAEPESGRLFLLIDDTDIIEWDAEGQPFAALTWRSKSFELASPTNLGALLVETDEDAVGDQFLKCRVYADGVLQREVTKTNQPQRLPAQRLARKWEVEVESNCAVKAIRIANTMDELA